MITAAAFSPADLNGPDLAALRRRARDDSPEALRAAAVEFEALFMQMMLQSMREARLGEGIFDNDQTRLYQEMFDQRIARQLARQGMGLAELLVRQLGREGQVSTESTAPAQTRAAGEVDFRSPAEFVARLRESARAAAQRLGVSPQVLLAQAALESGWGRRIPRDAAGGSSHNLFGIKAGPDWTGPKVAAQTLEFRDGLAQRERAWFRAYGTFAESFEDYADFILGNPRYAPALARAGDPAAYVRALQEAGYATDPHYAEKVTALLQRQVIAALGVDAPVGS